MQFGTAGIRAIMGAGEDRLNISTVERISQGLSQYLKDNGGSKVCISYDSRHCSRLFARTAAKVFARNGLTAIITKTLMPSPFLSFLVRFLGADAGVMITASHNTKEYNGYKVYGADGGQLTDTAANTLAEYIARRPSIEEAGRKDSFGALIKQGKIIQTAMAKSYMEAVKTGIKDFGLNIENNPLKIMYTPLNGAGHILVKDMLEYTGASVNVVPEQGYPDGDFITCPIPNPEHPAAFDIAVKYALKDDSDIIIATDPDADRVGLMVKTTDGYKKLSGNDIGVLLAEFLLRKITKNNTINPSKKPVIIRTVVSTPLVDKIASEYGVEIKRVLTGFKYIGQEVSAIESAAPMSRRFLLGFEESCGYLCSAHARDKDGVQAAALVALMAAEYKKSNKTLADALDDIDKKYGYYLLKTILYRFEGADAVKKMFELMARLRNEKGIAGLKTTEQRDFLAGRDGLPPTNMMEFTMENGGLIIRPSGTEPLIKVYVTVNAEKQNAQSEFEKIKSVCDKFFSEAC